ncbi:hypothetical protein G7Y79_00009g025990 [Physcia stellaris]|nr:hypothetical protein G7Y79_00009g025990 [Physcia stellaris]
MGMKQSERHTRDQTIFYMEESIHKLSANAAAAIVHNDSFKSFLLFLVDRDPKKMASILKLAVEKAAVAVQALEAKRKEEKNEMKEKRKAAEEEGNDCDGEEETQGQAERSAKKAKLVGSKQGTNLGAFEAARTSVKFSGGSLICSKTDVIEKGSRRSVCNPADDSPPPPYSSKSSVDNSDAESDDGVELAVEGAMGQAKKTVRESGVEHELEDSMVQYKQQQLEEEGNDAERDEDDEDNQSDPAEMDFDESRDIVVAGSQLQAHDQQTGMSEDGAESTLRLKLLNDRKSECKDREAHELLSEEVQANTQLEQNPDQTTSLQNDEQSISAIDNTKDRGQSTDHMEPQISKAELNYSIEVGLIRGDAKILSKFRETFPIMQNPESASVFELCQKLDFGRVQSALVRFHQNRLAEIEDPQKLDRMPSTCDLKDPDDIYDALRITHAHTAVAKIYRAYGQMRLFDTVNTEAEKQIATDKDGKKLESYTWHLEILATRKAGNVSDDERKAKIKSYKAEYHSGCKWNQVAKWFGGQGVIMVFILAGIGAYLIAKKLKDNQRLALKKLAPYLKSIRKMVKTLGPNALEDYCREGHLSKENF